MLLFNNKHFALLVFLLERREWDRPGSAFGAIPWRLILAIARRALPFDSRRKIKRPPWREVV